MLAPIGIAGMCILTIRQREETTSGRDPTRASRNFQVTLGGILARVALLLIEHWTRGIAVGLIVTCLDGVVIHAIGRQFTDCGHRAA